jgi:hypothetical protein
MSLRQCIVFFLGIDSILREFSWVIYLSGITGLFDCMGGHFPYDALNFESSFQLHSCEEKS